MNPISRTDGTFTVDAAYLAEALGLAPARVAALMRDGRITSRCEAGQDADAGRFRLTFFHAGRALRLTVDADGRILSRAQFDVPGHGTLPG